MVLMPTVGDVLVRQSPCKIEDETLWLPSDFPAVEREVMGFAALGEEEGKLREGQAFDALHAIRTAVRTVVALRDRKARDARGQAQNTRSGKLIKNAETRRNV